MQETRNTCKTSEWWINYDITQHIKYRMQENERINQQVTVTCSSRTKISIAASVYAREWWINYDIDPYRPTHKISNARDKKYMQDERVVNKLRYHTTHKISHARERENKSTSNSNVQQQDKNINRSIGVCERVVNKLRYRSISANT